MYDEAFTCNTTYSQCLVPKYSSLPKCIGQVVSHAEGIMACLGKLWATAGDDSLMKMAVLGR